jgi:hypothetical protein
MSKLNIIAIISIMLILTTGCNNLSGMVVRQQDIDDSQAVAEKWMKEESPTYTYDGKSLSHTGHDVIKNCEKCFQHYFNFFTEHTGYGDRSDEVEQSRMNQYHNAIIRVENGVVTSVILDKEWDDFNNKVYNQKEAEKIAKLKREKELEAKLPKETQAALQKKILCKTIMPKCPEYENPVCANDGKTYINSCVACQNEDIVIWYYLGECLT